MAEEKKREPREVLSEAIEELQDRLYEAGMEEAHVAIVAMCKRDGEDITLTMTDGNDIRLLGGISLLKWQLAKDATEGPGRKHEGIGKSG